MIPLKDQELIQEKFARELMGPVKIDLFTERELGITVPGKRPCQYCKPTEEMLREISGLHASISLRVHHMEDEPPEAATFGIERVPGIVLRGLDGFRLTFYGIPAGTEFPSFLETISDVSRREVLLAAESLQQLSEIKSEVSVRVFVTPTCPYCPAVARVVCQMAMVNPNIRSEIIEVNEYPELAERYNVTAVPVTVIADKVSIPGMVPEAKLVEEIVKAAGPTLEVPPGAPKRIERGKERPSGLIVP